MRKITRGIVTAFLDNRCLRKDNTTTDGSEIRLFGNLIAYWDTDSTVGGHIVQCVAITLAGWNSTTTRERLNGLLELMGLEKRIISEDGVPYIRYKRYDSMMDIYKHYTVDYDFLSPQNYERITGELI